MSKIYMYAQTNDDSTKHQEAMRHKSLMETQ